MNIASMKILIVHGAWVTQGGFDWGGELAAVIRNVAPDDGTWQVEPVYWGYYLSPAASIDEAIAFGRAVGSQMVTQDVSRLQIIGHSLGAYFIDGLAAAVREQAPTTIIQSTFLDAFTAVNDNATVANRGEDADFAESYYTIGNDGCAWLSWCTQDQFGRCVNVDVTAVNPGDANACVGSHRWPRCFYHRTVDETGGPGECDEIEMDNSV